MSAIAHFNLNLRVLCKEGRLKDAVHILLNTQNPPVETNTYLQLLQTCVTKKALSEGKQVHSHINDRGFPLTSSTLLQNKAINMYDKCGSLVDARKAFDLIAQPDVFSWNMIIAAYRRHGLAQEAFTLFHQMPTTGVQPDLFTFASILPVCTKMRSLDLGMEIHQRITESGLLSDSAGDKGFLVDFSAFGVVGSSSKSMRSSSSSSPIAKLSRPSSACCMASPF